MAQQQHLFTGQMLFLMPKQHNSGKAPKVATQKVSLVVDPNTLLSWNVSHITNACMNITKKSSKTCTL